MSHYRQLVDTIKTNFADYSSAQLQAIAQSTDAESWPAEARVAAREILLHRGEGYAQEPLVPAKPASAPPPPYTDPHNLGFMFGLMAIGLAAGFVVVPVPTRREEDEVALDRPVPFGPKTAWLALDTTDTEAVATALGLQGTREATWREGIDAAYPSSVFITPPLADWTLAVGAALFPPDRAEAFVKPLLERLSRQFGDAQYFCTHRDVELHVWARARNGRLVRGYGWLGEKRLTLWDEGAQTKEERDLGFRFVDGPSITAEPIRNKNVSVPDEGCVMQLAYLWSVDPTTLNAEFKEPVMGVRGDLARGDSRISR